jgi:hypothetical protein
MKGPNAWSVRSANQPNACRNVANGRSPVTVLMVFCPLFMHFGAVVKLLCAVSFGLENAQRLIHSIVTSRKWHYLGMFLKNCVATVCRCWVQWLRGSEGWATSRSERKWQEVTYTAMWKCSSELSAVYRHCSQTLKTLSSVWALQTSIKLLGNWEKCELGVCRNWKFLLWLYSNDSEQDAISDVRVKVNSEDRGSICP